MAPDSDGDIKMIDRSGVMALAACLPECRSLTSLKCAAAAHAQVFAFLLCEHFPSFLCMFIYLRQKPMSSLVPFRAHSFLVRSTSCTRSQTHTPLPHSHLRAAALLVPRVHRGHVVLSHALPHPHHCLAASPSQLAAQPPRRPGQAGHQRRCPYWHHDPTLASGNGAPRRHPRRIRLARDA
eukprot:scaffold117511_cov66-Phaeocystis_antarctica.AAC.5